MKIQAFTGAAKLFALFAAVLIPMAGQAEMALGANGSVGPVTVNGGEAITLTWAATSDITMLTRGWDNRGGTLLPGLSGSETIHARNPVVPTPYTYTINGYDAALHPVQASVVVNVVPNPNPPEITPIVWTPTLGFYQHFTLSFYILPDAEIGTPYSAILSASGVEPITYSAAGLPDGLTIVGNTIVGTPTTNAWMKGGNFTIIATDADGFSSATLARMMTPVLYPRVLTPVASPVVFDGGAPELGSAYVNDSSFGIERAASGFMLKTNTTVTGIRVWGTYLARFKAGTDRFTIKFYDHGPSPIGPTWATYPAAGTLIASFTPTSVARSRTGRASYTVPDSEYVYDLGFAGINLQSNSLYYVCVENNTQGEQWAWAASTIQNFPSWGAYSQDGVSFPGGSFELAFQLREGQVVQAPPTPVTYKLDIKRNGKGTVTVTPTGSGSSGASFAPGTVVTLTATPAAGSIWRGWTGDATGTDRTVSITVTRDMSVTANFR